MLSEVHFKLFWVKFDCLSKTKGVHSSYYTLYGICRHITCDSQRVTINHKQRGTDEGPLCIWGGGGNIFLQIEHFSTFQMDELCILRYRFIPSSKGTCLLLLYIILPSFIKIGQELFEINCIKTDQHTQTHTHRWK